jgi:pimeloyl-ACP methyl ester carboxylesterase
MAQLDVLGCRFHYDVSGVGPPVVFIQGTGVHGAGWSPQISALQTEFACLSFDHRGMGASQPAGAPVTIAQLAQDTLALMDEQQWPSAHVVGHSLGGLVALEVALAARARVRSLSLLCTFARGRDATRLTPAMLWTGLRTRIGTRPARRRAFLELVLPSSTRDEANAADAAAELAPIFGHDLAEQPPIVMKQLRAMTAYDATPRLSQLAGVPTLVVSAEEDRIAPPALGRALAAGIGGATYHELAGAAHGMPIQRAAEVNALLRSHFLQSFADGRK